MYWDGNKGNALVDLCISNTKSVCNDFDVRVLNNQTISAYIELPVFNEELPIAVKADYIRLALLKKYGGIWMDASIFLTENLKKEFPNALIIPEGGSNKLAVKGIQYMLKNETKNFIYVRICIRRTP